MTKKKIKNTCIENKKWYIIYLEIERLNLMPMKIGKGGI